MRKCKISVIVPIYKVEKYLCQCIDSILNQTLKDIEVILIDEGDFDACRAICDMYEFGIKKDNRIKSIHEKNGGYGASCNKGFEMVQGKYISIIEPDDFIEPTMYEEMYNYAKELDADVVKAPFYEYHDKAVFKKKTICGFAGDMFKFLPQNQLFSVFDYPKIMAIHASLWSGIYKTSYIKEKNIKFVEAKGAAYVDVGFRIDTLINTDKVAWLAKPLYNYRVTNTDSSANNFNLDIMLKRWEEVHNTISPEVYEKIGPGIIVDEYLNSAIYLFNDYAITQNHLDKMKENFKKVPDSVIKKSENLSKFQKKVILDIKYKNYKISHYQKRLCLFSLRKRELKIYVLRFMSHNILRILFRIGGIYVIDICIGKVK